MNPNYANYPPQQQYTPLTTPSPIESTPLETPQQQSFLEKAKSVYNKLQKPNNLPSAPKYGDFNAEAKNIFVSANEMGDGVNIQKARTVSASAYHEFSVVHGLSLASMMKPAEYNITLNNGSTTGLLYAQYTSNGVFVGNMKQKVMKGMQTEVLYINANDTFKVKNDFTGRDFTIESEWDKDKGRIALTYMQGLLKDLSAGVQGTYKTSDRKSTISGCVCYDANDLELGAEYAVRGSGPSTNVHSLKASIAQKYDDQLSLATELNYNLTERDASYRVGFAYQFLNGKVRVTTDEKFILKSSFDYRVTPSSNVNVVMEADAAKSDFKFGFNIQIQ